MRLVNASASDDTMMVDRGMRYAMDDTSMGRPIEFDENRVIENAMQAFWAQGVQAMTVAEMLEATGLARSSFYNSYGGKEALVVKAIERYSERDLAALQEVLTGPSLRDIVDCLLNVFG